MSAWSARTTPWAFWPVSAASKAWSIQSRTAAVRPLASASWSAPGAAAPNHGARSLFDPGMSSVARTTFDASQRTFSTYGAVCADTRIGWRPRVVPGCGKNSARTFARRSVGR